MYIAYTHKLYICIVTSPYLGLLNNESNIVNFSTRILLCLILLVFIIFTINLLFNTHMVMPIKY